MKTILFALLGFFLITIIPVYAQEPSFDDQLVSSEEYTKLVTSDYILEQKITELQKTNSELNSKLENLTSQITELKEDGIKFGIDEEKLGQAISNNLKSDNSWSTGDLLVSSATIFAFFGFGSFLALRFKRKFQNEQVQLAKKALFNILMIQVIHLYIIVIIIIGIFENMSYVALLIITGFFLVRLVRNIMEMLRYENEEDVDTGRKERVFTKLEKELKTSNVDKHLRDYLDDIKREYRRKEREMGE